MSENELSVFDIKFNEAMERLDSLFSLGEETNSSFSIKSYIERYRLDKSLENRNSKNKENKKNQSDEKRKQIVDLYEIRNHEKKTKQYYNKNYLKNEIEWYKIKQREDEIKNKYNNNYNKQNIDDEFAKKELDKEIIRNNKLKMKKFANLANKVNIEKFKMQRKININNINKDTATLNSNENNDEGKFIPYSKFREFEFNKIKNKIGLNINKTNINTNKSEMINNKSRTKSQNKINNHLSQNIINNNNQINLKKGNLRKNSEKNKALKPLNNNKYNIDIRKPLDEKIDYLRQMEKNRPEGKIKIYENKKLAKNKNNIELLNFHNKNLEDKAKRQEQLMRIKGNTYDRNEDNVKLSNLLIDSISTKLTILNQMASQNTS